MQCQVLMFVYHLLNLKFSLCVLNLICSIPQYFIYCTSSITILITYCWRCISVTLNRAHPKFEVLLKLASCSVQWNPPNKGHFGDTASVLISVGGCPLFGGQKHINAMVKGPGGASFVGRLSLSRRVLYRRFHCSQVAIKTVCGNNLCPKLCSYGLCLFKLAWLAALIMGWCASGVGTGGGRRAGRGPWPPQLC